MVVYLEDVSFRVPYDRPTPSTYVDVIAVSLAIAGLQVAGEEQYDARISALAQLRDAFASTRHL